MAEIIAEIGQNHNGDMALAERLIAAAKHSGAQVAKFQLFHAPALFPKENNPWYGYNCQTELTQEQVRHLHGVCKAQGIEFMASVFDTARIEWLEALGVSRYKVASRSIRDTTLIAALAETGKPLLVSLGHWKARGFPSIPSKGSVEFLYCISEYPALLSALRFRDVDFSRYAGFSDHTLGLAAAQTALARGARIIEKHFTLDKDMYGPDHQGSMTPDELSDLCTYARELEQIL